MDETLQETYTRLVPASRKPTREQQLRYLQLREEGLDHTSAARIVGSTGRRIRSALRRDPEFKQLFDELFGDMELALQERIRHEVGERAFDREDPQSGKFLSILAEARLPEMDYKRTRRVDQHSTGTIRHEHGLVLNPRDLSTEKLEAVLRVLEERDGADVIEATVVRELEEASGA